MDYFPHLLAGRVILSLLAGTLGGLMSGMLTGLAPAVLLALLVPFTLGLNSACGLALLGAAYTGAVAAGRRRACRPPGEVLRCRLAASFVGGLAGVFLLISLQPALADLAFAFGPSELFWSAVLGIVASGTLGIGNPVRGLFAGMLGAWIATIGYGSAWGVPLFVHVPQLAGGINLAVAMLGLLAIPAALKLAEESRHPQPATAGPKTCRVSSSPWRMHILGRGQRRRADRAAGVIAAASADSAVIGLSLAPLLALGVPGSAAAAALLGGLLGRGLFPGPDLFTLHAAATGLLIDSLLAAHFLVLALGAPLARLCRFGTRAPAPCLAAAIAVLAALGAYSVDGRAADVLIVITLGAGMYFFEKAGCAARPVVLGFVLGPVAQANWLQGRMIAGDAWMYFFDGRINPVLIALCVLAAAGGIFAGVRPARSRVRRLPPGEK